MGPAVDSDLLRRAAHDDDAFRIVQQRYAGLLWSVTASFRFDHQTREDIVQLVWLKLIQHVARIREPERLAGWLAATTRNECIRLVGARSRVQLRADLGADIADRDALDTRQIREETVRAVASALNELSPRCQALLRLLAISPPPSYAEISAALDMPVPSIGPTRQRCLKALSLRPAIVGISGVASRSLSPSEREGGQR